MKEKLLRELTGKRKRCVKYFQMNEKGVAAAVYPGPVHYEEDGEWKDIDNRLEAVTEEAAGKEEGKVQSEFYHFSVVPAMEGLRTPVDELEMIVDKEVWPMPSYGDLLFEV